MTPYIPYMVNCHTAPSFGERILNKIRFFLTAFSASSEESRNREKDFVAIMKEYGSVINGICFSYSTNADDLKDLRQDIMVNVWKGLKTFRGDSSVSTWIYRVALNTCVSTVRMRSKRPKTVPIENSPVFAESEGDDGLNDRIERLHSLIADLSPLDKAVITMWLDERKYEEIALVSGISRNNVAIRINRIKQKLANNF